MVVRGYASLVFSFPVTHFLGASFLFSLSSFLLHARWLQMLTTGVHSNRPALRGTPRTTSKLYLAKGRERQIGTPVAAIHGTRHEHTRCNYCGKLTLHATDHAVIFAAGTRGLTWKRSARPRQPRPPRRTPRSRPPVASRAGEATPPAKTGRSSGPPDPTPDRSARRALGSTASLPS
jgi:ribosomal protein L37E